MKARHARRIRFGILAARHRIERARLTWWQEDYLLARLDNGWMLGDTGTLKAHDREYAAAQRRWTR